jgi:hypothetical protein
MHSDRPPVKRGSSRLRLIGLAAIAVPLLLLAETSRLGALEGGEVALGALAASGVLWFVGPRLGPIVPALPALVGLGLLSATAVVSYSTELFAGVGGLMLLLAIALSGSGEDRLPRALASIALPGLGLALVLVTVTVVTTAHRLVGIAALILVVCLAGVALVLASADVGSPEPTE